ncbi:DUF3515 family protein [Streptomyces sp. NPDC003006]
MSKRALAITLALGACAGASILAFQALASDVPEPAPHAGSASCRSIAAAYPESIGTFRRTSIDTAAAAAVYGEGALTLRCGLPAMLPTEEMCVSTGGVDWVLKNEGEGSREKTIVTYGRSPAAEAVLSPDVPTDVALVELSAAMKNLPKNDRRCIDATTSVPTAASSEATR